MFDVDCRQFVPIYGSDLRDVLLGCLVHLESDIHRRRQVGGRLAESLVVIAQFLQDALHDIELGCVLGMLVAVCYLVERLNCLRDVEVILFRFGGNERLDG